MARFLQNVRSRLNLGSPEVAVTRCDHLASSQPLVQINKQNVNDILNCYDTILLDCDGVLWKVDHITPIPGIKEAIGQLRNRGKRLLFVTNNAMQSRESYIKKFNSLGGFTAESQDIYSVGYAAAAYLKKIAQVEGKVYMVGCTGLDTELNRLSIDHFGLGADPDPVTAHVSELMKQSFESNVGAVLVGYDEHFSFNKLFKAVSYLSREGCLYVATNDLECGVQLAPGIRLPVTGSIVAAVTAATRRQPTVIGKPHKYMLDCILAENPNLSKSRTLMIGDNLQTDIGFAKNAGIDSLLVLTGASTLADVEKQRNNCPGHHNLNLIPNFYVDSLADLGELLKP